MIKLKTLPTSDDESDGWTKEIPTESDTFWWFYGWMTKSSHDWPQPPRLVLVEVFEIGPPGQRSTAYVGNGNFMYPDKEGAIGLWKRELITLPSNHRLDAVRPKA